jgi:allophanate hydrolase subunit 2
MLKEQIPQFADQVRVHVILGPQDDMFTEKGVETFLSNQYEITLEADRMGYRLEGPVIEHKGKADIVSDALLPGAIQVPKSGKPIVIMRDAQTTGGYPKIAAVATSDVWRLGQAKPSITVSFEKITMKEGYEKFLKYDKLLVSVRDAIAKNRTSF